MLKTVIVFDLETDSVDPLTTNPIQFGAIAINAVKLEIIPNSEFYSWCCPDNIDDQDYIKNNFSTLNFHCKNYNLTMDELINRIKNSPKEKLVMENFITYIKRYHITQGTQSIFTAPALAGYNSFNFDFPILDRLCKKYKLIDKNNNQNIYSTRDSIDIMKIVMLWFNSLTDINSYSMDSIRTYFGMDKSKSHDAIFDVRQEAQILIKFLSLHQRLSPNINFKNCFSKERIVNNVN